MGCCSIEDHVDDNAPNVGLLLVMMNASIPLAGGARISKIAPMREKLRCSRGVHRIIKSSENYDVPLEEEWVLHLEGDAKGRLVALTQPTEVA